MRLSYPTAALLALGLGGCSALKPKADLTRFYVLRPLAADAPARASAPAQAYSLRIGPGRIPDYLMSPPMVVRSGANRVNLLDLDHWAEPLDQAIGRVVAENVGRALNRSHVVVYPDPPPVGPGFEVAYSVLRFEGELDGEVVLEVSWTVSEQPAKAVLAETRSRYVIPATGRQGDPAAYVARMCEALNQWSRDIAAALPSR